MNNEPVCPECRAQLIEIEHYRERYVGCVECNRWTWRGSKLIIMRLPEEEIDALRSASSEGALEVGDGAQKETAPLGFRGARSFTQHLWDFSRRRVG